MSKRRSVELYGVEVDALTIDETVERVISLIRTGEHVQHVVLNAAKVVAMQDDPALRAVIRSCRVVNADGASIVWASRLFGRPLPERVAGIDLFERLIERADNEGLSVFLLGAKQPIVERVVTVLVDRHPTLRIAGARNGYWSDDDEIVAEIRESRADLLFLAIPSPRKEFWLARHMESLDVPFAMGVGGTFDVVAGEISRAPLVMQRLGLEWFHRLMAEPRRMWKRYLIGNTRFIVITLRQLPRHRGWRRDSKPH